MFKRVYALLPLLSLVACYGPPTPDSCYAKHVRDHKGDQGSFSRCMSEYRRRSGVGNATYEPTPDPAVAELTQRYMPQVVRAMCGDLLTPPDTVLSDLDGVTVEQPCGLVVVDFIGDRLVQLVTERCGQAPDSACVKSVSDMFLARVTERYTRADGAWVSNHCTGYPEECDSEAKIETMFLKSHNASVVAEWQGELDRIGAERQHARAVQIATARLAQEQAAQARKDAWIQLGAAAITAQQR